MELLAAISLRTWVVLGVAFLVLAGYLLTRRKHR
jgi:LPXTG-motif cell wall-anchored protein